MLFRALKSFEDFRDGDVFAAIMEYRIASLVASGYVEVLQDPWRPTKSTTSS